MDATDLNHHAQHGRNAPVKVVLRDMLEIVLYLAEEVHGPDRIAAAPFGRARLLYRVHAAVSAFKDR